MHNWDTTDMPDLSGKVIVLTGANSGIGFEAAKAFAHKGAKVVLACRDLEKANKSINEIAKDLPTAKIEAMALNLASLESVHAFAKSFKHSFDRLDVLVNNAGLMTSDYQTTTEGFELMFGAMHLGHFALTGLLLDQIKATADARVVTISSFGHRMGKIDFDNLTFKDGKGFSDRAGYGRAKLANLLFTYELQRKFDAAGVRAKAVAAHPGNARTNLVTDKHKLHVRMFVWALLAVGRIQSAEKGALPTLRAATDLNVQGASYYGPNKAGETRGHPVVVSSSEASHNLDDAQQLWEASEKLTGVRYKLAVQN
jgi:NAD(P)-dependent dehydrogenase (short-subunit alcohol dehydrogenase family)